MSERNLSRRLSTSIVDALKAHGHILVVKGGATALARELEEQMSERIDAIAPRLDPWTRVDGEITSTFGDEDVDDEVEDLVEGLTKALVDSEHVEDVFAEDHVIRRDVFRVMRDALLEAKRSEGDEEGGVRVRLDTLGYVASTVGKRAPAGALREALVRAAQASGGTFSGYDPESREATFALATAEPDARLELEEAVADELAELVEANVVTLPSIDRRIELGPRTRAVVEAGGLRPRIDAMATKTLMRSGCAAAWDLEGESALRVRVTPLSEQDALGVDHHVQIFAREVALLLAQARRAAAAEAAAPAKEAAQAPARAEEDEDEDEDEEADEEAEADADEEADAEADADAEAAARPRATKAAATKAAATKAAATKAASAKATKATKATKAAKKAPAAAAKAGGAKGAAEKAPAKAAAKKAAAKKPAAKKAPAGKGPASKAGRSSARGR